MAVFREDIVRDDAQKPASAGHKVMGVRSYVSNDRQVEQMASRAVGHFGRLEAAFKNAGAMAPC